MTTGEIISLVISSIAAIAAIAAAIIALVKLRKTDKRNENSEGKFVGSLSSDVGYIKAGVDDLKRDNREMRGDFSVLSERVTRVEESAKQAHKRIDELKKEN